MAIIRIQGDATSPRPESGKSVIIAHLCNSAGGWGAGFVLAVSKVSPVPQAAYRALATCYGADRKNASMPMGVTQFVYCNNVSCDGTYIVANMIAQNGLDKSAVPGGCLVDYNALEKCLNQVFDLASKIGAEVHIPAGMGSGLAGGDKQTILDLIEKCASSPQCCSTEVTLWEFDDTSAVSYVPSGKTDE